MFRAMVAALGIAAACIGAASADDQPVVVELYTSQGCSSCPPADALLAQLAERDDVLALALHVDYWDYIGWKDAFADPRFTQRQRGYARAAGHRTIYTPQMIVQGRDHVVGFKPMAVADLIAQYRDSLKAVPMELTAIRDGKMVNIYMRAKGDLPPGLRVQLVGYTPKQQVEIGRGENAGKVITYANIVTHWQPLADWAGQGEMRMSYPYPGNEQAAVIVQGPRSGPIIAAARVE